MRETALPVSPCGNLAPNKQVPVVLISGTFDPGNETSTKDDWNRNRYFFTGSSSMVRCEEVSMFDIVWFHLSKCECISQNVFQEQAQRLRSNFFFVIILQWPQILRQP